MSIKLKALGLALVAACAMTAIAATSALAIIPAKFTSNKEHTILSAAQVAGGTQVFGTTVGTTECTEVGIDEATMASTSVTEITATPTYSGCVGVIGGKPVTIRVTITSCHYRFTGVLFGATHARVHIECTTPGDEIDIEAKFLGVFVQCLKVPGQTPTGGGVTYANTGTDHITVKATVTGIKYTEVGACGSNTNVNDGTYSGEVTVSGKDTGENTATLTYDPATES